MSDGLTNIPKGGHWAEDDVSGGSSRGPARRLMDWGWWGTNRMFGQATSRQWRQICHESARWI